VTLPEEVKRAYVPGSQDKHQLAEFVSQLVAYGKVTVDLPETDAEIAAIRGRMTTAARKADLKARTKIQDGKIIGWIPAARSKPRKKRTPKK